jgi:hypothetical protein
LAQAPLVHRPDRATDARGDLRRDDGNEGGTVRASQRHDQGADRPQGLAEDDRWSGTDAARNAAGHDGSQQTADARGGVHKADGRGSKRELAGEDE